MEGRTVLFLVNENGGFGTRTFSNCFRSPWLFPKILLGNRGLCFALKFLYSLKIADVLLLLMANSGKEFGARSFLIALCLRDCGPLATRSFSASWPRSFLMELELMLAIWSTSSSVGVYLMLQMLECWLWSSPSSVDDFIDFSFSQTERVETFLGR